MIIANSIHYKKKNNSLFELTSYLKEDMRTPIIYNRNNLSYQYEYLPKFYLGFERDRLASLEMVNAYSGEDERGDNKFQTVVNMVNSQNKYKDAAPFDTVKGARESLYHLGIETHEIIWRDVSSEYFSVRVEVNEFPGVGNNGKGTTRSFALASAYGELMERLQNKKLFNKTYGLKYNEQTFPDEKIDDMAKFSEEYLVI
jgi:hypothetical protein